MGQAFTSIGDAVSQSEILLSQDHPGWVAVGSKEWVGSDPYSWKTIEIPKHDEFLKTLGALEAAQAELSEAEAAWAEVSS